MATYIVSIATCAEPHEQYRKKWLDILKFSFASVSLPERMHRGVLSTSRQLFLGRTQFFRLQRWTGPQKHWLHRGKEPRRTWLPVDSSSPAVASCKETPRHSIHVQHHCTILRIDSLNKQVDQGALRLLAFVPEYNPEQTTDDDGHEESDGVVLRVSPVRPVLLPETSMALCEEWLRVLCWEVKVLRFRVRRAKLFDKLLVPPEVDPRNRYQRILLHQQLIPLDKTKLRIGTRITGKEKSLRRLPRNRLLVEPRRLGR